MDLTERIARGLVEAGWELGITGFLNRSTGPAWIVFGCRGASALHAEGRTPVEAWLGAARQAAGHGPTHATGRLGMP